MSLVFAAIAPHPPVLIPAIGKDAIKKVDKTKKAMEKLEEELYLSKPDCLVVISPHGSFYEDAFTLNLATDFETDLTDFGDISTKLPFAGEAELTSLIREASKEQPFKTAVISERKIDHGAAVPLYHLAAHLPKIPLLPVGFSGLDWKTHLDFGGMIQEAVSRVNKRVAVIASGDLSHALATDAPAGFNEAGPVFDQKLQELLANNNVAGMLAMDPQMVNDAAECGFRSFLILMGILRGINFTYKLHSYEAPFGVGYLVASFAM